MSSKICYVKYEDKASCDVAQHLTNAVFIDRPLVVVPLTEGMIKHCSSDCQLITLYQLFVTVLECSVITGFRGKNIAGVLTTARLKSSRCVVARDIFCKNLCLS